MATFAEHDSPHAKVEATSAATKAVDAKLPVDAFGSGVVAFRVLAKVSFSSPGGSFKVTAPTVPEF